MFYTHISLVGNGVDFVYNFELTTQDIFNYFSFLDGILNIFYSVSIPKNNNGWLLWLGYGNN